MASDTPALQEFLLSKCPISEEHVYRDFSVQIQKTLCTYKKTSKSIFFIVFEQ